jgi:hypothetical protein
MTVVQQPYGCLGKRRKGFVGRLALLVAYPVEYSNIMAVANENSFEMSEVERAGHVRHGSLRMWTLAGVGMASRQAYRMRSRNRTSCRLNLRSVWVDCCGWRAIAPTRWASRRSGRGIPGISRKRWRVYLKRFAPLSPRLNRFKPRSGAKSRVERRLTRRRSLARRFLETYSVFCFSFSRCSRRTALRLSLILLPSRASTLTRI